MTNSPKLTWLSAIFVAVFACFQLGANQQVEEPQGNQPANSKTNPKPKAEPPKAPIQSPDAVQALQSSREKIVRYQSIQAQMVQKIIFGDRKFTASGRYLQGSDLKLRLEFEFQIGDSTGSLLEVCDGEVLWTRQRIAMKKLAGTEKRSEGKKTDTKEDAKNSTAAKPKKEADKEETNVDSRERITRRDVREILEAVNKAEALPQNVLIAELGLGGIPALLASIERTFLFEKHERIQSEGKEFVMIEGGWKSEYLERWRIEEDKPIDTPLYVPDLIRVYFSADDHFPLRIIYLKKIAGREAFLPIVTMNFNNVVVNASINEAEFRYETPDGEVAIDITSEYKQRLLTISPAASLNEQKPTADNGNKRTETPANDKLPDDTATPEEK